MACVRAGVIEDEVDFSVSSRGRVPAHEALEEADERLAVVADAVVLTEAVAINMARLHVKGRQQRCRAVPFVLPLRLDEPVCPGLVSLDANEEGKEL